MACRSRFAAYTLLAGVASGAVTARAGLTGGVVNFNDAGDVDTHFNHTATLPYVEADGVGVGGSRGLQITGTTDSGAVFKTQSLNFGSANQQITLSMFLHTAPTLGTTGEDRIFELNIVGLETNIPTGAHTGVGGKLEFIPNTDGADDIGVEFRRNNSDAAGSQTAAGFDILAATWYRATFTATSAGAGNGIPVSMVLDQYNADGTSLVTAGVFSHSFTIAAADSAIASDVDGVFGAFRVRNGTRLLDAIDDFAFDVQTIPEPTTAALAGLALLALGARRRA
jgi:PEP-CTERM motif